MKTNDLIGPALDWAVAKCEKVEVKYGVWNTLWICDKDVFGEHRCIEGDYGLAYHPSRNWSQGGPIIEREMLDKGFDVWSTHSMNQCAATYERGLPDSYIYGPTPLIAAMRCLVASKLGDEIEIPKELQ